MESNLRRFLEGTHGTVEGKAMLKELVRASVYSLLSNVKAPQAKYRQKVLAKTASMTPLLTHAFVILNDWNNANAGDAIPWHHIKDGTPYILGSTSAPTAPGVLPAVVPSSSTPITPSAPSAVQGGSTTISVATETGVVLVTPPTPPLAPAAGSLATPHHDLSTAAGSAHVVTSPAGSTSPGPMSTEALTTPPALISPVAPPALSGVSTAMDIEGDRGAPRPEVQMQRQSDGDANLIPKETKRRKVSPQMVPAHHLDGDEDSAPRPKKKKASNPGVVVKRPVAQPVPAPDKLWTTVSERPTAMCDVCETRGHPTCETTGTQLACMHCRLGKTRCSYSALRQARRETMVASGELQAAKGSKKASGKKGQDGEVNDGKPKDAKATGKRKRQEQDASPDSSGSEFVAVGGIAPPATSAPSNPVAPPHRLDTDQVSTGPAATPSPATSLAPTASGSVEKSSTKMLRTPTLGGLQRELNDLRSQMKTVLSNQDEIMRDLVLVRGWFEVLTALKDDMAITVPALKAEMTGLRNGMELERMKAQIAVLASELAATKSQLAEFEDESGDEDEHHHNPLQDAPPQGAPPSHLGMPTSSMYVPPDRMRLSIRQSSPNSGRGESTSPTISAVPDHPPVSMDVEPSAPCETA